MVLLSFFTLIGRFHPVLVHLPIGILLLACLFQALAQHNKFAALQPAIPIAYLLGAISALASCVSGFMLSKSGDYDAVLVNRHQWMGIAVMLIAFALYCLYKFFLHQRTITFVSLGLVILVVITGHMGGSLTHGADYLSAAFENNADKGPVIKPMANVQEVKVYADMVQPLLSARCYSCHGPDKMKGKLRLDSPEFILKGGKSGNTVLPGKAGESDLIEKLLLPLDNKEHMPPKEKPQLTQNEISLLQWWINSGADFTKKTKELQQPDQMKPVLLALQSGERGIEKTNADLPEVEVEKAEDSLLKKLQAAGVVIIPVAVNSNYLSANFVMASTTDSVIKLLAPLQKQLVWLNLGGTTITDTVMPVIAQLKNLRKLHLDNTEITDKGLTLLKNLQHLQYINLAGTKTTFSGLVQLGNLKQLNAIYLYRSGVKASEWAAVKKIFPKALVDSGGYHVPTLAQDTTEVKAPERKG